MVVRVLGGRFKARALYRSGRQFADEPPPQDEPRPPVARPNYPIEKEVLNEALGASGLQDEVSEETRKAERRREEIFRGRRPTEILPQHDPEKPRPFANIDWQIYYHWTMEDAESLLAKAVALVGLSSVSELKEAVAQYKAAADATTSRSTPAPPRLNWETDRDADENPATFAHRAGYVHRGEISSEDKPLHRKLNNWLRTHKWPDDVPYIPTFPEWNEKDAAKLPELQAKLHAEADRRRATVHDFVRNETREVKRLQAVVRRLKRTPAF